MSESAATGDLVRLALAVLQSCAARSARDSVQLLLRIALMQTAAALCVFAALGCAMSALLIYARPILGGAGALLAGAGVFAVFALAAFGLAWRAGRKRWRSPAIGSRADTALATAASLFKQHTGLALSAALLAGVLVGSER